MAASEDHTTTTVPFTVVDGHELFVDIIFPSGLQAGKHPVAVSWHGGALITGSRFLKEMFPVWLPPWAGKNNAIVLSPDYRKLPEANGADIVQDVEAFWDWLRNRFPQKLEEISSGKHQTDLDHVLVFGGSAGGWPAMHLALSHPDQIRAVIVRFPMLVVDRQPRPPYKGSNPAFLGYPIWSKEKLDEETAKLKRPSVFAVGGMDRASFAFSALNWGIIGDWIGQDEELDVFHRVKTGGRLPKRLWIAHGKKDSVVPVEGTEAFAAAVQQHCPDTELRVKYYDGDHAWDLTQPEVASEAEAGLEWTKAAWLGD